MNCRDLGAHTIRLSDRQKMSFVTVTGVARDILRF